MADSDEDLKQLKQDYQITFSSKEGERVLADITSAYYHRGSYTKMILMKLHTEKDKDR